TARRGAPATNVALPACRYIGGSLARQEHVPDGVLLVCQLTADQRTAFGFDGGSHQRHARFVGSPPPFTDIALTAGTDDVLPGVHAAPTARLDVVQTQLLTGKLPLTVLAAVLVSQKDVSAIEFHCVTGNPVVPQQPDDPRNLDLEVDCTYPVLRVVGRFERL